MNPNRNTARLRRRPRRLSLRLPMLLADDGRVSKEEWDYGATAFGIPAE